MTVGDARPGPVGAGSLLPQAFARSSVTLCSGFYGFGGPFLGPFGPNQYCGTFQQVIGRPVPGQRVKTKKVHRCIVPRFAYSTLTVTYAAS
jgi:hypothetical protein